MALSGFGLAYISFLGSWIRLGISGSDAFVYDILLYSRAFCFSLLRLRFRCACRWFEAYILKTQNSRLITLLTFSPLILGDFMSRSSCSATGFLLLVFSQLFSWVSPKSSGGDVGFSYRFHLDDFPCHLDSIQSLAAELLLCCLVFYCLLYISF